MELSFTPYRIFCHHPFGISRSSHGYYDIVYLYLEAEGIVGRGSAAPSERYSETTATILSCLENQITLPGTPHDPAGFLEQVLPQAGGIKALEAALGMAVLDWWTQREGFPLYDYFGADPAQTPLTSFTIALGDRELIGQKIAEAGDYPILKIKLGTAADKEIIQAVRRETDKPIRVDANEGWDRETAREMCRWLAENNVEFVEQPLPASDLDGSAWLKSVAPLPIIADENCLSSSDIPRIATAFHGINIKLMKCGSPLEAKRMIDLAREYELQVMLGCMVESTLSVTAAAHLSPLVDYADLDGHLLINNDPYQGATVAQGRIILPSGTGIGTVLDSHYAKRFPKLK